MQPIFPSLLFVLRNSIRVATIFGLAAHFALTLVFVLPLNPVKMELQHAVNVTIGTWFPQNWSLFAPTPVQSTQRLLARCLTDAELPRISNARLPGDGWHDLSGAHFAQAQKQRFSAYERLVRPIENSLRGYLNGGPDLFPFYEACKKGDLEACKTRDMVIKPRREAAVRMLRKIGSAFCREAFPDQKFAGVALRLRDTGAVPWSQREEGKPTVEDFEIGVFVLDQTVALPGLYTASARPEVH